MRSVFLFVGNCIKRNDEKSKCCLIPTPVSGASIRNFFIKYLDKKIHPPDTCIFNGCKKSILFSDVKYYTCRRFREDTN